MIAADSGSPVGRSAGKEAGADGATVALGVGVGDGEGMGAAVIDGDEATEPEATGVGD